jgi:hypothetical protein
MFYKIQKFFRKEVFFTCLLTASSILAIKLFLIPDTWEFIEPISIYTALLSSVIFIYGFMIAPAVAEYKESEKIRVELKSTIENILLDAEHFSKLRETLSLERFRQQIADILLYVFHRVADDIWWKSVNWLIRETTDFLVAAEQGWIPANHIIKLKQEISSMRRIIWRLLQIKDTDSLPKVVHNLKNFITIFIITTLLFLNIGNSGTDNIFANIKEGIVIFILSFVYSYLSLIITSLENPFDKRNFSGYIDMSYLKIYAEDIKKNVE